MGNPIIKISVRTKYLAEQSDPSHYNYIWSYDITIENESNEIVQLLNRTWHIRDLTGKVEEVRGPGVIGLQPIIKPDKKFTYTSFCHLFTIEGTMEGEYEMQTLNEEKFIVKVPKFSLSIPYEVYLQINSNLH